MNNKQLNIVQTPIRFYPAIGGVENHVYYLSKELVRNNIHIKVICADEPVSTISNTEGITIERLPYIGKVTNTNICLSLPFKIFSEDFDIVHTHMPTPWSSDWSIWLAKLKGKKSVITIHNDMDKPGLLSKLLTKFYLNTVFRLSLSLVDHILIVNPDWEKAFTATKSILQQYTQKISVIPNGIDTKVFAADRTHVRSEHEILFVSILDTYHEFKGLNFLLEAVQQVKKDIPDIRLTVVGEGELKKYYQKMCRELQIAEQVTFVGEVRQEKLADYYSQAAVFVLPSFEIEGFGIVLLEAMACDLPVIATDIVGTSSDIQKYKTGIVIPPGNSKAITEALFTILQDKKLAATMGNNGVKLVKEKYDWEVIAGEIKNLYQKLIV